MGTYLNNDWADPDCDPTEYRSGNSWHKIFEGKAPTKRQVKVHRFDNVSGDALRLRVVKSTGPVAIAEVGIYDEKR